MVGNKRKLVKTSWGKAARTGSKRNADTSSRHSHRYYTKYLVPGKVDDTTYRVPLVPGTRLYYTRYTPTSTYVKDTVAVAKTSDS